MGLGFRVWGFGVYGDLIMIYPKPYSNYLRGTIERELGFRLTASI